jgi:hypothetical protein
MLAMRKMLRMDRAPDAGLTALELLQRTPIDRLGETVRALKKHRPAAEVRQAMIDLIAKAPLSDFETLKEVFLTHCTDAR